MAVWFIFDPKEFVKFEGKIEDAYSFTLRKHLLKKQILNIYLKR